MSERARKPAAFSLDDPHIVIAPDAGEAEPRQGRQRGTVVVTPGRDEEALDLPVEATPPPTPRRRFPWATLFWSAAGGLVLLAISLGLARLIEDLFARFEWLGFVGLALTALAAVALVVIIGREVFGIVRLARIETLRERAVEVIKSDDRVEGRALARDLLGLARRMPRLARARAQLESHLDDIIDGADLVRLAERELMGPLDQEARALVSAAAKRVSVVTAVSPRAVVDILFVLVTALGLVRRLAILYGGRPGTLGMVRLIRLAVAHLTVTGGLAASDSLIQQVVGHGVAARVSARLGEGVLNGLLTARLGLAAIEVTRPLPFTALPQPSLRDLAGSLLRPNDKA